MKDYVEYYVLGAGQPNDRAIYFTGTSSFHGGEYWGNITEAYLFETMDEVCERLTAHPELRCFIIAIANVTLDRCKLDKDLYNKFNTVSYVMNSK